MEQVLRRYCRAYRRVVLAGWVVPRSILTHVRSIGLVVLERYFGRQTLMVQILKRCLPVGDDITHIAVEVGTYQLTFAVDVRYLSRWVSLPGLRGFRACHPRWCLRTKCNERI